MITQAQVQDLFDYRDGKLFWKSPPTASVRVGQEAGYTCDRGYRYVRIEGKSYLAHRLIFLLYHGYLPKMLDHIDGNPSNNNIDNLREATNSENQRNKRQQKNNTTGFKGVNYNKTVGKYYGQIQKNGKRYNTTLTEDIKEAVRAVEKLRASLHGAFARN